MAIPIPDDVRELLQAPNYVHLSTLRADGSPRNWVVWAGLEDDRILVCTSDANREGEGHAPRSPASQLSLTDITNPYRMAAIQGRVEEVRFRRGLPLHGPDLVQVHETRPSRAADRTACAS